MDNNDIKSSNFSYDIIKSKLIKNSENEFNLDSNTFDDKIFESILINNLEVKNHFCFISGTDNFLCDSFGNPTEDFLNFYNNIARSDVGLIFTGGVYAGTGKIKKISSLPKKFAQIYDNKKSIEAYKSLCKNVHTTGAKIFLTIKSVFGRGDNENRFLNVFSYAPSFGKNFYDTKLPSVRISDGKCSELADNFGDIAELAERTNFDGVVIDASQYNILGEFCSTEYNRRSFGYFTQPEDFISKILKNIMKKTSDLNILVKLTISSFLNQIYGKKVKSIQSIKDIKNELKKSNFFELLLKIIKTGADGFVFEFGTYESAFLSDFSEFMCESLYSDIILEIRNFINNSGEKNKYNKDIVIVTTDNINNINSASKQVSENITDFVDITKQIYSDENYLSKIKKGENYTPCIKCSKCNKSISSFGKISCTVNPSLLNDKLFPTTRINKLVAVVGAGVAGITCAINLAERGFEVELYDKNSILNKTGKLCEIYKFDELFALFNSNLEQKLNDFAKKGKIKLKLSTEFDVELSKSKQYCTIIVATGFHEKFLNVSGAVLKNVKSIYDILESKNSFSEKNNIVVLAKSELSLKLALYLVKQNKKVRLVIPSYEFLFKLSCGKLTYYINVLNKLKVDIFIGSRIKRIEEDFIELVINRKTKNIPLDVLVLNLNSGKTYGYEACAKNIDCDLFIYEPELYSNNRLYYELAKSKFPGELYLIGNALKISDVEDDIKNAYFVAKNL